MTKRSRSLSRTALSAFIMLMCGLGATGAPPLTQEPASSQAATNQPTPGQTGPLDFVAPVPTYKPRPPYTDKALKKERAGAVLLSVGVDALGDVTDVTEISKKLGDGLDRSAVQTVKTWRFTPAMRGGQPVPARINLEVDFSPQVGGGAVSTSSKAGGVGGGAAKPTEVNASYPGHTGPPLVGNDNQVFAVGGEVIPPVPLAEPTPPYTKKARKARVQGMVVLSIIVDREGFVKDAQVLKPLDKGLDQSALNTVKTWKFRPATRDGVPVAVRVMVEVTFRLT